MGKHRSLQEQLEDAQKTLGFHTDAVSKHLKNAHRLSSLSKLDEAKDARTKATNAQSHMTSWRHKVRRLEGEVARQTPTAAEMQPDKKTLQIAKRMKNDPRTAAGRRAYDLVGLGTATRASLNHFTVCFPRTQDRTGARVLAWAEFDLHCYKAYGGLIPPSRFEPGVDSSRLPEISNNRIDAMRRDAGLREELGTMMHGLLVQVIHHQKTFKELATNLNDEDVARLFYAALDMVAHKWRIQPDNSFGQDANRPSRRRETA